MPLVEVMFLTTILQFSHHFQRVPEKAWARHVFSLLPRSF